MNIPEKLRYTEDHEWVRVEGEKAFIGITDHAQDSLGDIVYVELPEVGLVVSNGDEATNIESVKAASPIYAPVSGTIAEVNEELDEAPERINEDPYGTFIFSIQMSNPEESKTLLDAEEYATVLEDEE
jgi:glycine cleavage system H protein